jgi:uncharacterized protein YfaT (DUF1175 family)
MVINKENFIIFQVSRGWIVYNRDKEFKQGHTHIRNKKSAIDLVNFALKESIPRRCSNYYLISLSRISSNTKYVEKVLQLVATRKGKGRKPKYRR